MITVYIIGFMQVRKPFVFLVFSQLVTLLFCNTKTLYPLVLLFALLSFGKDSVDL